MRYFIHSPWRHGTFVGLRKRKKHKHENVCRKKKKKITILTFSMICYNSCQLQMIEAIIGVFFILGGSKTGQLFPNRATIISKQAFKHFLVSDQELPRSTFMPFICQLIYMLFRLGSGRPVFHVFFHHKMLDDYAECHPTAVESQKVCGKTWVAAERRGKTNLKNLYLL